MYIVELSAKSQKVLRKMPAIEKKSFERFLDIFEVNPFDLRLKTHKLHGDLKECYSSRINFANRAIFTLKNKNILVTDIGSHDDVY